MKRSDLLNRGQKKKYGKAHTGSNGFGEQVTWSGTDQKEDVQQGKPTSASASRGCRHVGRQQPLTRAVQKALPVRPQV